MFAKESAKGLVLNRAKLFIIISKVKIREKFRWDVPP